MNTNTYRFSSSPGGPIKVASREKVSAWRIVKYDPANETLLLVVSVEGPLPEELWMSSEFSLEWDER